MNTDLFKNKISKLTDEKILVLLKLRYDTNREVVDLAMAEARKRNMEVPQLSISPAVSEAASGDLRKLEKWNWAACILAPYWTLANKLYRWAIPAFIPGINIPTIIYLGFNGNRLAYEKSQVRNIDDFMMLQARWSRIAVALFWISSGLAVLVALFSGWQ